MIQLRQIQVYHGPNPYSSHPVILAAARFAPDASAQLDSQMTCMGQVFASWWSAPSRQQGEDWQLFVARFLASWSLAALNEVRGYLQAAGVRREGDDVLIWLGFHDPRLSFRSLSLAAGLLTTNNLDTVGDEVIKRTMSEFWVNCRKAHPDYQAKVLMEAARANDIPYLPFISKMRLWQFGWGCNSLTFFESRSEEDSHSGMNVVKDKAASKLYFEMMGAPVARHRIVSQASELDGAAALVGWPCVLKPLNMGQAKGVTVNIRDGVELHRAFARARSLTKEPLMVESHVDGDVHRLLVIRGQFYAATRREPATVEGDGVSTLIALVDRFNRSRTENATPGSYLGPVPVDAELDLAIAKQGCRRDSVVEKGRRIRLREIPLQGTGASNRDVSHLVHPDIKAMAEILAKSLAVQIAGFDYLTSDISRSYREVGAFLEINGTPSLRGHLENDRDVRGVGAAILGSRPARIPVVLVVAPAAEVMHYSGQKVNVPRLGWRCGDQIGLGSTRLKSDGRNPVQAVRTLLVNRCVESVLMVCEPAELIAAGMLFDRVDHCLVNIESLPASWQAVLQQHSGRVSPLPPPDGFASCIGELLGSAV